MWGSSRSCLREGDELGVEGGPRIGCVLSNGAQHPRRDRAVIGTASFSGPRKGDRWTRSQPGSPGKNKRTLAWNRTEDKVAYIPGPGSIPEERPVSQASRDRAKHEYLWNTVWVRLRCPAWTKTETPDQCVEACGEVPGDTSQDLLVCSEPWQSVSFPIHPAYSRIAACTVTAKEISPAHIQIIDWCKGTCLFSFT